MPHARPDGDEPGLVKLTLLCHGSLSLRDKDRGVKWLLYEAVGRTVPLDELQKLPERTGGGLKRWSSSGTSAMWTSACIFPPTFLRYGPRWAVKDGLAAAARTAWFVLICQGPRWRTGAADAPKS